MIKYFTSLFMLIFTCIVLCHEKGASRASIFKDEIKVSEEQFKKITSIDNRYKIIYQKLQAELTYKNASLSDIIQKKPFNESKTNEKLREIFQIKTKITLHSIKHHIEIELILDSFQKMKFNEIFNPY